MRSSTPARGAMAVFATVVACADGTAGEDVFRIPVTVESENGDVVFASEIADSPAERSRGLMFRESMQPDRGMLFLFPRAQPNSFWMKNTYIPLDLIFIREDRTILGIVENAAPRTTTGRSVPGESQFVLEINGGMSEKLGIRANQRVRFTAPIPLSVRLPDPPASSTKRGLGFRAHVL